jgi:vacuolar-type H+-ATPase subunit H
MGKEPEVIEKDIASTREDLSRDFDALADKVSPSRVVGRRVDTVKGKFAGAKDKVMGTAHDTGGSLASAPGDAASSVTSAAQGNPLAAGLVAFGLGWLVSSIAPASQKEAQLAGQAVQAAKEHGQPLIDEAKSVGQEMGANLKDKATEAATELKDSATESAQHVKDEGQSATRSVTDEARNT